MALMISSQRTPLVSVIVVYWNNRKTIVQCLSALAAQTMTDFEIVLIDNGSTDEGLKDLAHQFPQLDLRIERLSANQGFAIGNNIGARLARGQWLALLNADAFPTPDWLANLLDAAQRQPEFSFFASCLLQANDPSRFDGAGDVYHITGLAWRRFHNQPLTPAGLIEEEVFSPCGAAALFRREAFLSVGGFDEDFGSYHEDVDLGFRLRLLGERCLYVPRAIVYHVGSVSFGKKSHFVVYHGHRNLVWTYIKNMPTRLFWQYLPAHLFATVFYLIYYSLNGNAQAIWQAKIDALRGMPNALRKRRKVQRTVRVHISDLDRVFEHSWTRYWNFAWYRR